MACIGNKNAVVVALAFNPHSIDSEKSRLFACRIVIIEEFHPLFKAWCLPVTAPMNCCGIIFRQQFCKVVGCAIVGILRECVRTILSHRMDIKRLPTIVNSKFFAHKLIRLPAVFRLALCLAPGKIIAKLFRSRRTNVASSP